MRVGVGRADFRAHREERPIDVLADIARLERFAEAWPPRARLELVERAEERLTRHDIHIDPRPVVVPVLVVERGLGGLGLGYSVLRLCAGAGLVGRVRLPELLLVPCLLA